MSIGINTVGQGKQAWLNELDAIASQAWGHRLGERSKGGNGYMGVMKRPDGTIGVFKCLTNKKEYKAFHADSNKENSSLYGQLVEASKQLKNELVAIATQVKMADEDVKRLRTVLGGAIQDKGALSRKVVAKAVTDIYKAAKAAGMEGTDAANFWARKKGDAWYSGKVKDTRLRAPDEVGKNPDEAPKGADGAPKKENRNSVVFADANATTHISELRKMETAVSPTTVDELQDSLLNGPLSADIVTMIDAQLGGVGQLLEKCKESNAFRLPSIAMSNFGQSRTWLMAMGSKAFDTFHRIDKKHLQAFDRLAAELFERTLVDVIGEAKQHPSGPKTFQKIIFATLLRTGMMMAAIDVRLATLYREEYQSCKISDSLKNNIEEFDTEQKEALSNEDALNQVYRNLKEQIQGKYSKTKGNQMDSKANQYACYLVDIFNVEGMDNWAENVSDDKYKEPFKKIAEDLSEFSFGQLHFKEKVEG